MTFMLRPPRPSFGVIAQLTFQRLLDTGLKRLFAQLTLA